MGREDIRGDEVGKEGWESGGGYMGYNSNLTPNVPLILFTAGGRSWSILLSVVRSQGHHY